MSEVGMFLIFAAGFVTTAIVTLAIERWERSPSDDTGDEIDIVKREVLHFPRPD